MICFLDLDGVLVDFVRGACKVHNIEYDYNSYPFEYGEWDTLPPPTAQLTTSQFWDTFDADFWANLDWMYDGRNILELVERIFGQENICLLTTPTLCSECSAGKIEWIRKNLPQYHRQFFIGPPKHFCAHDKAVLVDDRDKNVGDFGNAGGYGILLPRPWNKDWRDSTCSEMILNKRLLELYTESTIWKD